VWHLYVARHPERDRVRTELEALGVQTGLHYPIPLHLQKAYRELGYREGDFPVAEQIGRECLTLPLFPEMTAQQQTAVVEALEDVLGGA
jgi:dTDP-4-amino-4,6-dideoxygalactose transaminase